ncbi:MAG: S41 family peptidase [bacterium]|nr:S41 family peptidase [bacterium]
MFNRKVLWITAIVLILNLSLGRNLAFVANDEETYQSLEIFSDALTKIKENFVDPEKTHSRNLIYGAIKGMVEELDDPYTRFMTPEVYREMKVETKGEFGGLGIVITIKEGKLTVISPIEGTPAYRIGIKAGDIITHIEGEETKDITLFEAVHKLRGPKGTKVTITVKREGEEDLLDFTIIRDIIEIESVKYSTINKDIGYVRITTFNQNTHHELKEALSKLEKEEIKNLIIDLRNNPGGLLSSAVSVSDMFIKKGTIVSTKGRIESQNRVYYAREEGTFPNYPLVVLINKGSASGSEIVAGAIKDLGRGVILGERSFGKGSVQTVLSLPDESGLVLSTARYYTPNGTSIHEKGIDPHIIVEGPKFSEEEKKMLKKLEKGGYIKEFAKGHPNYTEDELDDFLTSLKEKEIKLDQTLIKSLINKEIRRIKNEAEPVYELETDPQLKRAVDILVAQKILSSRER